MNHEIDSWWAGCAGSSLLSGLFSSCSNQDYSLVAMSNFSLVASFIAVQGLQVAQTSVGVVPGLQSTGSIVLAYGLSHLTACGILLDQGLNLGLPHWQADSLPLGY